MTSSLRLRRHTLPVALAVGVTGVAVALLAGCGSTGNSPASIATPAALHITGSAHGGQQPLVGSRVYLYSVASYAGGPSTSLLSGAGYVTTDQNGAFTITGDYTCPTDTATPVYMLALGGNPGLASGTYNTAVALMASIGPCSSLTSTTFINLNELSTAAAVTGLQGFITDETHIGAGTVNAQNGYSAPASIANAMTTVNNLYNLTTGQAMQMPVNGNGVVSYQKLNTLGNILAACINTASPTSSACQSLFTATTPAGGTMPTDTIGAMLQIARNPGTNVSPLFMQGATVVPFQPALATAPNDFSLSVSYTASNLTNPGQLSLDNGGNVWIANCASCVAGSTGADAVVAFSPAGAPIATNANYTLNVHKPVGLSVDQYNHIWVLEAAKGAAGNQVTVLGNTDGSVQYGPGNNNNNPSVGFPVNLNGTPGGISLLENDFPADGYITDSTNGTITQVKYDGTVSTPLAVPGVTTPTAVIADGLRNVYIAGTGTNVVVQYNTLTSGFTTLSGSGITTPNALAADGGDHIWTTNSNGTVSELLGYTGAANSGAAGYAAGLTTPGSVSIDGAGTAWITNCRANCGGTGSDNIVHLSAAGTSLLASDGLQSATLATPTASAIDLSGNLWVSNATGSNVTEIVGVAAPVVLSKEAAASLHALGTTNYLVNGGFENGAQVKGDSSANAIPGWTYTSSSNTAGAAGVDHGTPFSYNQKLTFYNGSAYQVSETQTLTGLPSGNYLASCYVAGDPNHNTRTASITAVAGGVSYSNALANLNYGFQPFTVANIAVSNGSLTLSLNDSDTAGGYVGWDSCSVTQQ